MSNSLNRKYKEIGSRIASLRILAGITREEFCRKYKVNEYTLQAWELGRNKMRKQAAEKLCYALDKEKNIVCTVDWIYFGKGLSPYCKVENTPQSTSQDLQASMGTELDQEMILRCEIDFFKRLHVSKKPVVVSLADQAMCPLYNEGDHIGAIAVPGEYIEKFHGEICVIETVPQVYMVRRFLKGDGCFILMSIDATQAVTTVHSIKGIFEIIWCRYHPKNLKLFAEVS